MREARDASRPSLLLAGEWHLPYIDYFITSKGKGYFIQDEKGGELELILEDAIKVSCARAAAVSFRNTDYGLLKCREVYDRLVGDERKHASALEHQATPMVQTSVEDFTNLPCFVGSWEEGVTHADRAGNMWSGNFKGFIQHRKMVAGENKES
jgi:hypothetical protein